MAVVALEGEFRVVVEQDLHARLLELACGTDFHAHECV